MSANTENDVTYTVSDLQLSEHSLLDAIKKVGIWLKASPVHNVNKLHDKLLDNFNTYDVNKLNHMFNSFQRLFIISMTEENTKKPFDPKHLVENYTHELTQLIEFGIEVPLRNSV